MRVLCFVLLIICLLSPAVARETTALICDLQGKVELKKQSEWVPLALLDDLAVGDVVRVEADSNVLISTVERGDQFRLLGPCTARVSAEKLVLLSGSPKSLQLRSAGEVAGLSAPVGLNIDRMGGLMRPKPGRLPRWSTDALVAGPNVDLTWEAPDEFSRFRVELVDESGETFLDKTVEGRTGVPVTALPPGSRFEVRFSAWGVGEAEPVVWEGELETLSIEELDSIPIAAESVSELTVRLTHQLRSQLFTPALATCRTLQRQRPDDPNLLKLQDWLETFVAGRGI